MRLFPVNHAGTVYFIVRDEDGEHANPDGTVSVVVTDADGDTVATGTATQQPGQTHNCSYPLPAEVRQNLGRYTVTFSYVLDGISESRPFDLEIVGEVLFDIAEIRSYYPEIADANRYPLADIRTARDEATERLEQAAQVAFATRRTTALLSGDQTTRLLMPHVEITTVHAVTIYDDRVGADAISDAFDATELLDVEIDGPAGVLKRVDGDVWPYGHQNILVDYEHGYLLPPDAVRRVAMKLAIERLVPSALPSRALSQTTDLGEVRISVANPEAGRPTGDPEIDSIILQFGRRRPTIG